MAAALTRNSLQRSLLRRHSPHYLWGRTIKHSTPVPASAPKNAGHGHQLQQSKWCNRYPHTFSRRAKDLEDSATSFESSSLCSRASSSPSPSSPSKFGFVGWYLGMVQARPIVTKSLTSSFIYTAADLSSQTLVGESSEYDFVRTLRMAGYGMIVLGPSLHYWFNFASRVFPRRDFFSTIKKIVLGQLAYGPVMTAAFFSVNAGLQGESGSEIVARVKRDVVPTMVKGLMYWPICDFITFKFIPVHLQPVVSNSFSYVWTIYLTYVASFAKVDTS
ncbi:protein SYM1-like [Henckelia pumila]|uniref:protein SYM1-like n=1 Tax=Henckelia pumila TaxID=405737 RepID=UPI003C6E36FC